MKKTLIILLAFITALIITLPFPINSVSGATKNRQSVVIETYDASDGLLPGVISAIYQDSKGDLWIGSWSGVSRFDGKQFQNFTMKNGFPSRNAESIAEDDKGNLWFGSWDGVIRYDGTRFQKFTQQEGLRSNLIEDVLKDDAGQLWFTTNKGLMRYDGEKFYSVGPELDASSKFISNRNGNLWFSSESNGIFKYDGENFQQFTEKDGLISNSVLGISEDSAGNLWFGSYPGASRYDGNIFHNFFAGGDEGFPMTSVRSILEDSSGNLWFTGYEGLCEYDGRQFELYTVEDGLPTNRTIEVIEDWEGNLWIGTQDAGIVRLERNFQNLGPGNPIKDKDGNIWCSQSSGIVSKYDGRIFQPHLTQKDGIPNDAKLQYIDTSGNLWLQSPNGIWKYDGKHITSYLNDGIPPNAPLVHIDSSGNLWLNSYKEIWMYDGKDIHRIFEDNTIHDCSFALEDSLGCIWIKSLYAGALKYEGQTLSQFTAEHGLPIDENWGYPTRVTDIVEDNKGNIWMATYSGVFRSEGRDFQRFLPVDEFKDFSVVKILKDNSGNLWFGTRRNGVCRYDGKQFQWFASQDGLASDWIEYIYEDSGGHLWFNGRGDGVAHFDEANFQRLTTKDGLPSNAVQKILEDEKTSTMLFVTERGIIRYAPPAKRVPPHISVERIIADKSYDDVQEVQLTSTATHITFEYYGKSFRTKKMRYNYVLEGYESEWHKTWDERAEYENVKPGNYTFKVIAIDRDLVYSEEPATVKLKVVPPFYLRAGFLAPTVGFGTILIAMLTIVSIGYIKRRREVQAYQRAAVEELRDANRVQMSLMPESAPPIEGVEIAGRCIPANTVSGDFFDYLEGKRKNEIALVVADVTGKAMKGAMNAVMTDGILRMAAEEMESLSPASLMAKINNVLKTRMEQYMNVTMVIGTIDVDSKTLTLANAAHHAHPILLNDGEVQILKTGGLPLGMRAGIEYSEEQFPLESGDVVILMTDGIIEVQDSEGQPYADSGRLEKTISQFTPDLPAEAMVDAILNDVMHLGGDKSQRDDDMTVVVAKIR